jgi:hypothetical protein
MKKNRVLLATLALAATLSPAVFAQQDHGQQPNTTDPSRQTVPSTNTQPATPDSSADAPSPKSFSGTVTKAQKQYVLKTDTGTYQLDDQARAKRHKGKKVTVSGTLDRSTSMIRVTDIQPAP